MADCNDLNQRRKELEQKLEDLETVRTNLKADEVRLNRTKTVTRKRVLKTMLDDEIEIDQYDWWKVLEEDALARGDEQIQAMVQQGFDQKQTTSGIEGQMINFNQIKPSEENMAEMLKIMELRRVDTKKGIELMAPFTNAAATRGLINLAKTSGGDPRAIGQLLTTRLKGIDKLPLNTYTAAYMRYQSGMQYANAVEELADALELTRTVPPETIAEFSNIAKWAYFFENIDATVRRKVGQSLQSLQKGYDDVFSGEKGWFDFSRDLSELTIDDITGESLLGQTLEHVRKGDHMELRKIATTKRLSGITGAPINESQFKTQLRLLNIYRKDNMFTSVSTWAFRNPISGIAVSFDYAVRDLVEGSMRVGIRDGLKAFGYANRSAISAWSTAVNNASQGFMLGRQKMGGRSLKEVSQSTLEQSRLIVDTTINDTWDKLVRQKWDYWLSPHALYSPLTVLNLMNASVRKVLGQATELAFDSDWGYFPAYRALTGIDEGIRTLAFAHKTHHEAYIRAVEELRGGLQPSKNFGDKLRGADQGGAFPNVRPSNLDDLAQQQADAAADKALFSGYMSDKDLVKFRQKAVGMPAGEGLSNDQLRQQMFNDLNGVPNTTDELGAIGFKRGEDVTFTGKFTSKVNQAIDIARTEPWVAWFVPVHKTAAKGVAWIVDRDILVASVREIVTEWENLRGNVSRTELAQARANVLTSAALFTGTNMLWQMKLFSDGGPTDRDEYKDWIRSNVPYAFKMANSPIFGAAKFSARSIDLFDLMGLQADLMRAWQEGWLKEGDIAQVSQKMIASYARVLSNKASLKGAVDIFKMIQNAGTRDMNIARTLSAQLNGILPISGGIGNTSRAFQDPAEIIQRRRSMTAAEKSALEDDPNYKHIAPLLDFLGHTFKNYPILGHAFPLVKRKDWLGTEIKRPFGLPYDWTIPFMPVEKPDDPLYDWLYRHGFGSKPHPDGKLKPTSGYGENKGMAAITMTDDEENFYREKMRTMPAALPANFFLGDTQSFTIVGELDRFLFDKNGKGLTLKESLRKLSLDLQYNELLSQPDSPSKELNPTWNKSDRIGTDNLASELQRVYNGIINYYDRMAAQQLLIDSPTFLDRWKAIQGQNYQRTKDTLENMNLGVGYQ